MSVLSEHINTQSQASILLEQPSVKDLKNTTQRKSIMQIVQNKTQSSYNLTNSRPLSPDTEVFNPKKSNLKVSRETTPTTTFKIKNTSNADVIYTRLDA